MTCTVCWDRRNDDLYSLCAGIGSDWWGWGRKKWGWGGEHPLSTGCEHQSCSSAWQPGGADTQKKNKTRGFYTK